MIDFFRGFLIDNLIITVIIFLVFIINNAFKNSMFNNWNYKCYLILVFILFIPFLPINFFSLEGIIYKINNIINNNELYEFIKSDNKGYNPNLKLDFINDFAVSVKNTIPLKFFKYSFWVWVIICLISTIFNLS